MKLAKQFDLNMNRQHIEKLQNSEETNCRNLQKLKNLMGIHPESVSNGTSTGEAKVLSHEEELHALFDGPTQHLSGRLSPPSTNCSQESRTEKTATHEMRPATSDNKNLPGGPHVTKPDLDDDWENDDLLRDLFVLEVTQNPQLFSSCTAKTTTKIGSADSRKCKPTMADSSSASNSRPSCPQSHQITGHYTRILSKTCTDLCTFRSNGPVHSGAIKQLRKSESKSENPKAHAMGRQQLMVMTSVCPETNGLTSLAGTSGNDLDFLWGDADDDLLYQACDDLERISASQEQQRDKNSTNLSLSSTEVPLSIIVTSSSNMSRKSRTVQSQHPTDYKQPLCVLARSHSIPGASSIHGNKQYLSVSGSQVNQCLPQNSRQQYHFTHSSHTTGQSGENFHHSTFKRHQSDPGVLRNKGKLSTATLDCYNTLTVHFIRNTLKVSSTCCLRFSLAMVTSGCKAA